MKLLPDSLFSRLMLVLMAGLVIAQVLSIAIHAHERGRILAHASGVYSAQRIGDIVDLLESIRPEERARFAAVLSTPPLVVRLGIAAPPPQPPDDAAGRTRATVFEHMLRRRLGDDRTLSVVVTHQPASRREPGKMQGGMWGMHGGGIEGMRGGDAAHGGLSFVASVRLRDGAPVVFDATQPPEALSWPYRILGSLAILLAAVVALSLIAVRWATRPLHAFAAAADKLGTNINRPPLDESGPLEVRRAARALNTMQAKLIGYLSDRTRILAAMSHDLKTPITRLRLRAELLDDEKLKARFEADLAEMEALVGRTLEYLRGIGADEPVQAIDVDALVQSVQRDAQEVGHEVAVEGTSRAPYRGRPQTLRRCLTNLVDNAVKYGRSARVVIDDSDSRLEIRVIDKGPGIPAEALEQVFDPFYRLEASRSRDSGGTGLGLSIARNIAEAHGGTLKLANLPRGGLEATLTLPRATSDST